MARKKKRKRRSHKPSTLGASQAVKRRGAPPIVLRGRRSLRIPLSAALAGAAVVVMAAWVVWQRATPGVGTTVFPPPPPVVSADGPTLEDFAGADACAQCHKPQYDTWRASTHGNAGGVPSRSTVLARFDSSPIRFSDAVVIPSVNQNGEYIFTVQQVGRDPVVFTVAGVVGRGHMLGGGTQGFLSEMPDGTLRLLPFDFIRREGVWFCDTNTRANEGWVPIAADMSLADCGHWPPMRVFGTETRFANCQECHGSQISIRFDRAAGRYDTHVGSLSIDCESCHGPAKRHAEMAQSGQLDSSTDIGLRSLGLLHEDASLEVCFQCHAVKDVIKPGYLPGKRLQDHYSLLAPLLAERPFLPDGRVRTFAYQMNHLASDCYLNGTMSCVDCHDPHGQGYRDVYGRPLESRFSNGQCTSCHASKAEDPTLHTKHGIDSPGSQCVSCHMPYLQHQAVGTRLRFARSDHSIAIPRPAFDSILGVETACNNCHEELSVTRLQEITESWYGEVKPHKSIVTGILRAERGETTNPALELLHPDLRHPMAQVAALDLLIANHLRPNMPALDPAIRVRLERLADHANNDVRAVALASLHYAAGQQHEVRALLADRLASLGKRERAIRERWVLTLTTYGDAFRERRETGSALVMYDKALEVQPNHAGILRNIGLTYTAARNFSAAVEFFNRSLAADPQQPLALVGLGVALKNLGQELEAMHAYRRALELNPTEALAYFNLGNVHLMRNEFRSAIAQYRSAVTFDPGHALGHYYLARSLIMVNDLPNALASVRKALEFDQGIEGARATLQELELMLGR